MKPFLAILLLISGYWSEGQDSNYGRFKNCQLVILQNGDTLVMDFTTERARRLPFKPGRSDYYQYLITNEEYAWILKRRNDLKVKPVYK